MFTVEALFVVKVFVLCVHDLEKRGLVQYSSRSFLTDSGGGGEGGDKIQLCFPSKPLYCTSLPSGQKSKETEQI
jgi:hypothetical protein